MLSDACCFLTLSNGVCNAHESGQMGAYLKQVNISSEMHGGLLTQLRMKKFI
jgi:hypothetical protein